jgi:hypothetical protein
VSRRFQGDDDSDDHQRVGNGAQQQSQHDGVSDGDNNNNNNNHDDDDGDGDGDDGLVWDDNDRYCYCRLKWDGVAPMLECDGCGEWFHFVCVSIDPALHVPKEFYCIACEDVHGDGKRLRRLESSVFGKHKSALALPAYVEQVRPLVAREPAFTSDGRLARVIGRPLPTVTAFVDAELKSTARLATGAIDRRQLLLAVHRLDSHWLTRAVLYLKQHAPSAVRLVDLERIELDFAHLDEMTAWKLAMHVGLI